MIFTTLELDALKRLTNDAWCNGINLVALNQNANPIGAFDTGTAQLGLGGVVSVEGIKTLTVGHPRNGIELSCNVVLRVREIPLKNRRTEGFKTAFDLAVKAMSLWGNGWSPNFGVWQFLRLISCDMTEVDDAKGRITWTMVMETKTHLGTITYVLGNQSGDILVNQNQEPLLVSPTNP